MGSKGRKNVKKPKKDQGKKQAVKQDNTKAPEPKKK